MELPTKFKGQLSKTRKRYLHTLCETNDLHLPLLNGVSVVMIRFKLEIPEIAKRGNGCFRALQGPALRLEAFSK